MSTSLPTVELLDACRACTADADGPSVDRRTVLAKGVLAVIATVLTGACATSRGSVATVAPLGSWALRIKPSDFPELAATWGIARVDGTSDKPVAVVRTADGYQAFSLRCPHAGVTLDPQAGGFVCPGHGARFGIDGTWAGGHRAKNLKSLIVMYDARKEILTITG